VENQRRRLIQAVPGAIRDKGFAALTVEDVCARAGVSRRTFYENFRDAGDCFVASYRHHMHELTTIVSVAAAPGGDWEERARLAVLALLRYLAQRPDVAHMAVIEVLAAGPAAIAERDRASAFLRLLIGEDALAAASEPAPGLLLEVVAGATIELISRRVLEGNSAKLEGLLPTIMYLVLVAAHGPAGAAVRAGLGDAGGGSAAKTVVTA
jgi:AcrR family transcriptional regulator